MAEDNDDDWLALPCRQRATLRSIWRDITVHRNKPCEKWAEEDRAREAAEGQERLPWQREEFLRGLKINLEDGALLIRAENDRFRSSFVGGRVFVTQGVNARGREFLAAATAAIQAYSDFLPAYDGSYNEHDFGALTVKGVKLYWMIDCYDDPADLAVTARVLAPMSNFPKLDAARDQGWGENGPRHYS